MLFIGKQGIITPMKTYTIPVVWEAWGKLTIEADSLAEAIEKAQSDEVGLPKVSEYIDDSFKIDYEGINCHNIFEDHSKGTCGKMGRYDLIGLIKANVMDIDILREEDECFSFECETDAFTTTITILSDNVVVSENLKKGNVHDDYFMEFYDCWQYIKTFNQ